MMLHYWHSPKEEEEEEGSHFFWGHSVWSKSPCFGVVLAKKRVVAEAGREITRIHEIAEIGDSSRRVVVVVVVVPLDD